MKKIFNGAIFSIGIIALIMAFLVTLQIKSVMYNTINAEKEEKQINELLKQLNTVQDKNAQLTELNSSLQADLQSFKDEASANSDYSKTLVTQLSRAEIMAGLVEVEGNGIIVTVKDSTQPDITGNPNNYLIHDTDLLTIINELRGAGAEAVSLNNERIIATSEIRCVGPTVSVNNTKIGSPFIIKAIGDPITLENALMIHGGVYDSLTAWGLEIEINKATDIVIPAYSGLINFQYAKPITEGSGE